jgi:quercetin dioxygenase-like cupin family protein
MERLLGGFDLAQEIGRFRPEDNAAGRRAETLVKTEGLRVVLVTMRAGATLREHTALGADHDPCPEGALHVTVEAEAHDLLSPVRSSRSPPASAMPSTRSRTAHSCSPSVRGRPRRRHGESVPGRNQGVNDRAASPAGVVDLLGIATARVAVQPAWFHQSADLNVNLVVFEAGDGIDEHVNPEVDVLLVGVTGAGTVTMDGERHPLVPGTAIVIPKGVRRGIRADDGRFAYVTCHRRRAGLWPTPAR